MTRGCTALSSSVEDTSPPVNPRLLWLTDSPGTSLRRRTAPSTDEYRNLTPNSRRILALLTAHGYLMKSSPGAEESDWSLIAQVAEVSPYAQTGGETDQLAAEDAARLAPWQRVVARHVVEARDALDYTSGHHVDYVVSRGGAGEADRSPSFREGPASSRRGR